MNLASVVRNVGSSYAGAAVNGAVLLVLTPLVVRMLGTAEYGIWVLASALGSYFGFLNAGSGAAGVRAVASLEATGKRGETSRALGSIFRIYLAAGVVAAAGLATVSFLALDRFRIAPERVGEARALLLLIAANFLVSFPLGLTRSALAGLHRFGILNGVEVGCGLFRFVVSAAVLLAGFGLVALGAVQLVSSVAGHAIRWLALRRIAPHLSLTGGREWAGLVPGVPAFSALAFGTESLRTLFDNADLLILGFLAGPPGVAAFGVALTLASLGSKVLQPLTGVFFPLASRMEALGQRDESARALTVATRVNLALSIPVVSLLLVDGDAYLRLWIGEALPGSATALRILAVLHLVSAASTAAGTYLFGAGRVGVLLKAETVRYALNLALAFPAYRWLGLPGVAAGTLLSVAVVDLVVMAGPTCRATGLPRGSFLARSVGAPVLAGLPVLLVLAVWRGVAPDPSPGLLALRAATGLAGFGLVVAISAAFREERKLAGKAMAEVIR